MKTIMKKYKLPLLFFGLFALAGIVALFHPSAGLGIGVLGMAVGTRFSDTNKANAFDPQGIASYALIAYAATISPVTPTQPALRHYIDVAQMTGAMTMNFSAAFIAQLREGDEIYINVSADATGRTLTWGTNVRAAVAATFVLGVSFFGVAKAVFLNGKIHILAQTAAA